MKIRKIIIGMNMSYIPYVVEKRVEGKEVTIFIPDFLKIELLC